MKKMINFKSLAMIIAMILSMSVMSCVPEPDGPAKPETETPGDSESTTTEIAKAVTDFSLYISDGLLKMYDVVAVIKIDDQLVEEKITDVNWRYLKTFGKDEIPSNVSCKVTGTAKNPLPEIEDETLKISCSKSCRAYLVDVNNVETNATITSLSEFVVTTMTIASNKAEQYISESPVHDFLDVTYNFK